MIDTASYAEKQGTLRIIAVALILFSALLALIGRFFYWQILCPDSTMDDDIWHPRTLEILPRRGDILDCTGHPLALEIPYYHICCAPKSIKPEKWPEIAERLAALVGEPRDAILNTLRENSDKYYARLAWYVPAAKARVVKTWNLGLYPEATPGRGYPEGDVAGHILGFVNVAGKGSCGVEGFYNEKLAGEKGLERLYDGPRGSVSVEYRPAKDGADLVLTVNRTMQYEVEKALREVIQKERAESGTIIVLEPKTGAILAMASFPSYDPNNYAETPQKLFPNPAISKQYEPGSVMKIVTLAAGLDSGIITQDSTYIDNGYILVGGRPIRNSDGNAYGRATMTQILAHSLNVGAATISMELRADRFYRYLRSFGFGELSGVDLAGEVAGTVHIPGGPDWSEADLGTNAFGQGIAVTPLQMVTAVAAVANGGVLMKPYIVKEVRQSNRVQVIEPKAVRRVISSKAARDLTEMMVEAVETGAKAITVEGHLIAGKTGTAEIPIPGGYDPRPTAVVASFVGFAPAEDPRFVILVNVEHPQVERWGGTVAGPVFRALAKRFFTLLDIPPNQAVLAQRQ